MSKPLVIDLFCGLGGWAEGFLAEGYDVIGFDIERRPYPGQLVLQDVCTLEGRQLRNADVLVASSPCQEFSYRAMPWKRANALGPPVLGIKLFWQAFRLQLEIFEATGRMVPLVAENVRGAERYIGPARWHFGSYYLWGDVPPLMPIPARAQKFNPDGTQHGQGSWFKIADSKNRGSAIKGTGGSWFTRENSPDTRGLQNNPMRNGNYDGVKQGGEWWHDANGIRRFSSRSNARKQASAEIAKIPFPLAQHIARTFRP